VCGGLTFSLIPSTVSKFTHCLVRGSLAKLYTDGVTNAFDFTANMVEQTISDLQSLFGIDPAKAVLENFEFGLNITLPETLKSRDFFRGLIAYKGNGFATMNTANNEIGVCIGNKGFKVVKIYDKSRQDTNAPPRLIRIEIAVKRMRAVEKYGIKTLADLNRKTLTLLADEILDLWRDCIYVDGKPNFRSMTAFEQKKWLYYTNPKNWEGVEKKKRYRMKQHFAGLKRKYVIGDHQAALLELITAKARKLTGGTNEPANDFPKKCVHLFHNFSGNFHPQNEKSICPPFPYVYGDGKGGQNTWGFGREIRAAAFPNFKAGKDPPVERD